MKNKVIYIFTLLNIFAGEVLANPLTQGVEKAVSKGKTYIGTATTSVGLIVTIGFILHFGYNLFTEGYRNEPLTKVISTKVTQAVGIAFFVACVAIGEFVVKELS